MVARAAPVQVLRVEDGVIELRAALPDGQELDSASIQEEGLRFTSRPVVEALIPEARQTTVLLVSHTDDVRSVREIARGWGEVGLSDDTTRLAGLADTPFPRRELKNIIGSTFSADLPVLPVAEFLTTPGGMATRQIVICTGCDGIPPTSSIPKDDGTFRHAILLTVPNDETEPAQLHRLRRLIKNAHGEVLTVPSISEGIAAIQSLENKEPRFSRVTISACVAPHERVTPKIFLGVHAVPIPKKRLPNCPTPVVDDQGPPPAVADSSFPLQYVLWGLGAITAILAAVGIWLSVSRPKPRSATSDLSHDETFEADEPGTIRVTPNPDAPALLTILRGTGLVGEVIPLDTGRLTVGASSGNDAMVDLQGISGRHARFERFQSGDLFVYDADSANGTWVQGRRLARGERVRLRHGDRVLFGPSLEVEVDLRPPSERQEETS